MAATQNALRHAAGEQVKQGAVAMRAEHDEIGLEATSLFEDGFDGGPLHHQMGYGDVVLAKLLGELIESFVLVSERPSDLFSNRIGSRLESDEIRIRSSHVKQPDFRAREPSNDFRLLDDRVGDFREVDARQNSPHCQEFCAAP